MIKEFLEKAIPLCTECELTAKRLVRSITLDIDYEMNNKDSEFAMADEDFSDPFNRMSHLFLFKHMDKVDTKKAKRVESHTNLVALKSYKNKYKTADYDEAIVNLEREIASAPIPEIDAEASVMLASGGWL